jgi:transcriptional regulator with XRE-family HTH domain
LRFRESSPLPKELAFGFLVHLLFISSHDAEVDRAYMSRVERAVTYVGLEIIEKLAVVLEVDPAEFFRRPLKRPTRKKSE